MRGNRNTGDGAAVAEREGGAAAADVGRGGPAAGEPVGPIKGAPEGVAGAGAEGRVGRPAGEPVGPDVRPEGASLGVGWINVRVSLGELVPWADNPRMSNKRQAQRLLDSWAEFGQVETIAIGPGREVYDGHQRLTALLTVHGPGYEIDARQATRALTDDERRRLVLMLHAGGQGGWNWEALAGWDVDFIAGVGLDDEFVRQLGVDKKALAELLNDKEPDSGEVGDVGSKRGHTGAVVSLHVFLRDVQLIEQCIASVNVSSRAAAVKEIFEFYAKRQQHAAP